MNFLSDQTKFIACLTFIANIVSQIIELLPDVLWTSEFKSENPADYASRGIAMKQPSIKITKPFCLKHLEMKM